MPSHQLAASKIWSVKIPSKKRIQPVSSLVGSSVSTKQHEKKLGFKVTCTNKSLHNSRKLRSPGLPFSGIRTLPLKTPQWWGNAPICTGVCCWFLGRVFFLGGCGLHVLLRVRAWPCSPQKILQIGLSQLRLPPPPPRFRQGSTVKSVKSVSRRAVNRWSSCYLKRRRIFNCVSLSKVHLSLVMWYDVIELFKSSGIFRVLGVQMASEDSGSRAWRSEGLPLPLIHGVFEGASRSPTSRKQGSCWRPI